MDKNELQKVLTELAKRAERGQLDREDLPDNIPQLFGRIAAYSWTFQDVNDFADEMVTYDDLDKNVREIAENVLTHSKWDREED